jgi:hydrogenase maturation protease
MDVVCIGIGSDFRQDDSVGLRVAEVLNDRKLPGVRVSSHSREGFSLLNTWDGTEAVILIDAVSSGAKPGTVFRFVADSIPIPRDIFLQSTHSISVGEAIELAQTMNQLPPWCIVFGIEGERFDFGTSLTPAVAEAVPLLVDMIVKTIKDMKNGR